MKRKSTSQSAFFNLRPLAGLFVVLAGVFLALFATANPSKSGGRGGGTFSNASAPLGSRLLGQVAPRTFMRVTPEGVVRTHNRLDSEPQFAAQVAPEKHAPGPLGNTLWRVDDQN